VGATSGVTETATRNMRTEKGVEGDTNKIGTIGKIEARIEQLKKGIEEKSKEARKAEGDRWLGLVGVSYILPTAESAIAVASIITATAPVGLVCSGVLLIAGWVALSAITIMYGLMENKLFHKRKKEVKGLKHELVGAVSEKTGNKELPALYKEFESHKKDAKINKKLRDSRAVLSVVVGAFAVLDFSAITTPSIISTISAASLLAASFVLAATAGASFVLFVSAFIHNKDYKRNKKQEEEAITKLKNSLVPTEFILSQN
jgi:hypothetical protein